MKNLVAEVTIEEMRPRKKRHPGLWAEEERVLTSKESTVPGRYSLDIVPFLREISKSLFNPRVETVVAFKPVQSAITTLAFNWVGQRIDEDPTAMLYMLPGDKTLKKNLSQKIEPLLGTPAIKTKVQIREESGKKQKSNHLEIGFPGGILYLANANSSTDLRNVYAELLIGDEVDEWVDDLDGQGDPLSLMLDRSSTALMRKVFIFSTGVSKEFSKIEPEYKKTDMRRYHVPCPHCGEKQVLLRENLHWERGNPRGAFFSCTGYGCVIEEKNKMWMVQNGIWIPQRPEVTHAHGYWWNMFIQVLGYSWTEFARKWEASDGNKYKRKTLFNNQLAETTEDAEIKLDWALLHKKREVFPVRKIPRDAVILTAGADVQQNPPRIEVYVWAWGPKMQRYLVDVQVFSGPVDLHTREPYEQFAALLNKPYPHELGGAAKITIAAIDSREYRNAVLGWVSQDPTQRMAVYGVGAKDAKPLPILGIPKHVEIEVEDSQITKVPTYPIGVSALKFELFTQLAMEIKPDGDHPAGYIHLPENEEIANQEILEQLVGEVLLVEVDKLGRPKNQWKKIRKRNEALDCTNYARAAAFYLRLDAWSDDDWKAHLDAILSRGRSLKDPEASAIEQEARDFWGDDY